MAAPRGIALVHASPESGAGRVRRHVHDHEHPCVSGPARLESAASKTRHRLAHPRADILPFTTSGCAYRSGSVDGSVRLCGGPLADAAAGSRAGISPSERRCPRRRQGVRCRADLSQFLGSEARRAGLVAGRRARSQVRHFLVCSVEEVGNAQFPRPALEVCLVQFVSGSEDREDILPLGL